MGCLARVNQFIAALHPGTAGHWGARRNGAITSTSQGERPSMPELPEVETARRRLQPAMEGSKIVKADARRRDLRLPFQKDFVARLTGQTVTGLGRRAKYLLADLASDDALLIHLGMSGSF